MGNISYICYIVEKNTNLFVDYNTNMTQVYDRFDSWEYEQRMLKNEYDKSSK